jgi:hypothetical protein
MVVALPFQKKKQTNGHDVRDITAFM